MDGVQNFVLAFVFSFFGSIPPGTINLTVLQLGLERKTAIALRFIIAASVLEYPYAWLAVEFEELITGSPFIIQNFKLIGAILLFTLGVVNLWSARKPTRFTQKFQDSGFRRGLILGLLNPMAMPYWIAITAYLRIEGWITISNGYQLHSYLLGIVAGAIVILVLISYTAKRVSTMLQPGSFIKILPGAIFLILGAYSLFRYFVS
jgi:threonine/homoserine/homoserine lactone efflux protein